jgi:hypothetical protein
MDYILQLWGQDNIFIRNSWGTEVFATVQDSVLHNSWGTNFGCLAGAVLGFAGLKVCNKVFIQYSKIA